MREWKMLHDKKHNFYISPSIMVTCEEGCDRLVHGLHGDKKRVHSFGGGTFLESFHIKY
jgi:hypothetical protein